MVEWEEEGLILTEIKEKKKKITVISTYNVGRWGKKGDRIDKIIEEREMNKIIIGADFNIRIGKLDSIEIKEGGYGRSSKDTVIGNEDRKLLEWIKEKRWYVLNGSMKGD